MQPICCPTCLSKRSVPEALLDGWGIKTMMEVGSAIKATQVCQLVLPDELNGLSVGEKIVYISCPGKE